MINTLQLQYTFSIIMTIPTHFYNNNSYTTRKKKRNSKISMITIAILIYYYSAIGIIIIPSTFAFSTLLFHNKKINNSCNSSCGNSASYHHHHHVSFLSTSTNAIRSSAMIKVLNDKNQNQYQWKHANMNRFRLHSKSNENHTEKDDYKNNQNTPNENNSNKNTNDSSYSSILPPYRTTSNNTGINENVHNTKKWKSRGSRRARATMKKSFNENDKNNDDIPSSSSSSILPPFPPSMTYSSSSFVKPTTINDFRKRQKQKLNLRKFRSTTNSNRINKSSRRKSAKSNERINNNHNVNSNYTFNNTGTNNKNNRSTMRFPSSSSSSVLPPPRKGTTTRRSKSFLNSSNNNFVNDEQSKNHDGGDHNNNIIAPWSEFLSKENDNDDINTNNSDNDNFSYSNNENGNRRMNARSSRGSTLFKNNDYNDEDSNEDECIMEGDHYNDECQIPSFDDLPPPSFLFGRNPNNIFENNQSNNQSTNKNQNWIHYDEKNNDTIKEDRDINISSSQDRLIVKDRSQDSTSTSSSLPSLDGVLPVSELFYRSTQSLSDDDDDNEENDNQSYDNDIIQFQSSNDSSDDHHNYNRKNSSSTSSTGGGISSTNSDDEELPFSAEQSDSILTRNNKICLRRNSASTSAFTTDDAVDDEADEFDDDGKNSHNNHIKSSHDKAQYRTDLAKFKTSFSSSSTSNSNSSNNNNNDSKIGNGDDQKRRRRGGRPSRKLQKKIDNNKGRKMIRRGMEMLVGGEPINADPPLRFVELHYCFDRANSLAALGNTMTAEMESESMTIESSKEHPSYSSSIFEYNKSAAMLNWAGVITTNSRDFGPLLHQPSVEKVSEISKHIYCEHFVNACMKWQVCPRDLKVLTKKHKMNQLNENNKKDDSYEQLLKYVSDPNTDSLEDRSNNNESKETSPIPGGQTRLAFRGFGKSNSKAKMNDNLASEAKHSFQPLMETDKSNRAMRRSKAKDLVTLGGELKFTLGLTRADLENGNDGSSHILRRVLGKGIATAIRADSLGFNVVVAKLILNENDEGETEFNVAFNMVPKDKMQYEKVEQVAKNINSELARALDYNDMALAIGAAAKAETAWPARVRKRIVEEFLFDGDDDDEPVVDAEQDQLDDDDIEFRQEDLGFQNTNNGLQLDNTDDFDGPFGMPGDTIYASDDIYLGGGNGGVFSDYSEDSIHSSPWQGKLGPLLVDATVQRALQRQPRVIAIGDVHGCLDELQALLRRCDYRPGDLIVFLGDLVSKGPDSLSVVQMARELGAIGVRGNHDFEVIRWHQAIKSGADPPVVGSEHYSIASNLQKADLKWMYSLPWYLSSKELGALFVHAGFVSGIRLGKQNPRLMMNMRSILPDGTVTSKFFNNWPWARLWDGPQTVLFGHDADRGLQQYEHAIGLDTGCVYGGRLTACILPEKRLVSVSARRAYFQYRRKHFD